MKTLEMSIIQQQLIDKAVAQYGRIRPCGFKSTLAECFTEEMGGLQLWFNVDQDNSTRMVEAENN